MAGAAVTFLSITLACMILRLHIARKIIGFLSVTDTYIQTISEMQRRISCLALRRLAIMISLLTLGVHVQRGVTVVGSVYVHVCVHVHVCADGWGVYMCVFTCMFVYVGMCSAWMHTHVYT